MQASFAICHPWVLTHEGGYVDHPDDPGGATNQGVTQGTYNAWRRNMGHPTRSVRHLTESERDTIYRQEYWDRIRGDDLPVGLDYAVYDFAVNSGVSRAAKYLQRIVGTTQDGIIGAITLAAVDAHDPEQLVRRLCADRMAFLRRLRHWPTFGRGWTRRVMGQRDGAQDDDEGVIDRAVLLAKSRPVAAPIAPAPGKAIEPEAPTTTKEPGMIGIGTGGLATRIALYVLSGVFANEAFEGIAGVDIDTATSTITINYEVLVNLLLGGGALGGALGWRKVASRLGGKT